MSEPRAITGVLVSLDYQPIASYAGGVPGLAPTSPSATGQRLGRGSPAERAYEEHIVGIEQEFESDLNTSMPEARITARLRVAFGGVAVTLPADRVADLRALVHVVDVQPDRKMQVDRPVPGTDVGR
jgi:membrane-bound lytic murein transglycosylase MltF